LSCTVLTITLYVCILPWQSHSNPIAWIGQSDLLSSFHSISEFWALRIPICWLRIRALHDHSATSHLKFCSAVIQQTTACTCPLEQRWMS
jgi:hypothetical protein